MHIVYASVEQRFTSRFVGGNESTKSSMNGKDGWCWSRKNEREKSQVGSAMGHQNNQKTESRRFSSLKEFGILRHGHSGASDESTAVLFKMDLRRKCMTTSNVELSFVLESICSVEWSESDHVPSKFLIRSPITVTIDVQFDALDKIIKQTGLN